MDSSKATHNGQRSSIFTSYPGCVLPQHELDTTGLSDVPFGHEMRKTEFAMRQDCIFINHGNYGAVPKRVLKLQHEYIEERESHSDLFHRLYVKQYVDKTRGEIASAINAQQDNVMIVSNSTTDVERILLDINLPIQSEDEIVSGFEDILDKHPNTKVAVIDHISSPTSMVLPVARLVKLCQSKGVFVFVDGAHAFGQLSLDMEEIGADAYVSSLHKWGFSSQGVAMLWFAEKHRSWVRPQNIIWEDSESLDFQFHDQGSREHIPFICARHSLQFFHAIGGMGRITDYTSKLANEARDMLCKRPGLEPLGVPQSMEAPNMKVVQLPLFTEFPAHMDNLYDLHKAIFGSSHASVAMSCFNGRFLIRICAAVYNTIDDYVKLGDILEDFIEKHGQK